MTHRFGLQSLTIQYFCDWEHLDFENQEQEKYFEFFHTLLERCFLIQQGPPVCFTYCLGSCLNENQGRLLLACHRYRENGMEIWKWSFFKCFQTPSEFLHEDLDALFQIMDESVLPFRMMHEESVQLMYQKCMEIKIHTRFGTFSNMEIAQHITQECCQWIPIHFTNFIWTADRLFDRVSLVWKCPILPVGTMIQRSLWIQPHWTFLQSIFNRSWYDFKTFRNRDFQFSTQRTERSSSDFFRFKIDNFLPINGIGHTFKFKPWENWTFETCSVAFYCRQRTRVKWGVHPFVSCESHQEQMHWIGTDQLMIRFIFQQKGGRVCDSFMYEAECIQSYTSCPEQELLSSMCWIFGQALEQCLFQQIENIVFDELGFGHSISPFAYMDRLQMVYEACQFEDVHIYPMRYPHPCSFFNA
jgi:hypothetical protein